MYLVGKRCSKAVLQAAIQLPLQFRYMIYKYNTFGPHVPTFNLHVASSRMLMTAQET